MSATRHLFQTDDLGLAAKIHALILSHNASGPAAPAASLVEPPPVASLAPPAPPTAAPPPPPPIAAPAPPPPAPPVAAAPPPPPPVAAAPPPPPAAVDNALNIAPAGWTLDHIKQAASTFTANPAKGGAAALAEVLRPFCPAGEARPSIKKVLAAYWPMAHAKLTEA